jgi:hypothetical protein
VWPVGCPEGSPNFSTSETLDDSHYLEFAVDLHRRGFELTWHGATMESSTRERTLRALERYRRVFGAYPRIHVNHALNRENIYWGAARFDSPVVRALVTAIIRRPASDFAGGDPTSPYWWGDVCAEHIQYARNLTTNDINTARFNPSMPYRDPRRPLVPWWFSASDAEGATEFAALISSQNQARLEAEGGYCIVATHFGKGFVENGAVRPDVAARLEELAARDGWFPTVGELLDWLLAQRNAAADADAALPPRDWRRMQWRWAYDLLVRKVRERRAPAGGGMA